MNTFQDFKVVDIGHGNRRYDDPKIKHREALRKGNTESIHKAQFNRGVSKVVAETTEAMPSKFCNGKDVIELRTSKKKTQKELAGLVNEKPQLIQLLEQGKLIATPENKRIHNKIKQRLMRLQ